MRLGCAKVSVVHVREQDLPERRGRFHRGQHNFRGRQGDFRSLDGILPFKSSDDFSKAGAAWVMTQFAGRLAPGDAG